MKTIKIFDCSDNPSAPQHREVSRGNIRNDIMKDLEFFSLFFSFKYIKSWKDADVVITNTTLFVKRKI